MITFVKGIEGLLSGRYEFIYVRWSYGDKKWFIKDGAIYHSFKNFKIQRCCDAIWNDISDWWNGTWLEQEFDGKVYEPKQLDLFKS